MNDGFLDNDRELNARLDRAVPPHTRTLGETDTDPLTRLAQRLAQGPDVLFSDTALDRIETRLNAQMDTISLYSTSSTPRRRRIRFGRLARQAVAAALALLVVMTTVTQTTAAALPGDRLYPIKRAVEEIHITLVTKDGEAALRLRLAERRIGEFEALLERDRVYPRALEEANEEMSRALDLLTAGHGDWMDVDLQFHSLMIRDTFLLDQAMRHPIGATEQIRLNAVTERVVEIQQQIEILHPAFPPVIPEPLPTPMSTVLPTISPTMTPPPTDTPTLTVTATPSVTPTPTLTSSPILTVSPAVSTHHAPTGTGGSGGNTGGPPNDNPTPAQGGENPSQGEKSEETGSGQGVNPSQGNGK
ncbi:MAG: hypothetical protein HY866_17085 [Chloroflexi bacterium]|nr:hypothetical protein [Chloroflexota bacterium]